LSDQGRVIANFGAAVAVQLDNGQLIQAVPLTKLPLLVAGDIVECEDERVSKLLDRTSVLQRGDQRGKAHPLAANLTHLAIVSAQPPGFDKLLIDQFCVAAENANIAPIIILNKIDLYTDEERSELDAVLDKSVALVGASGVGKSSLIKFLLPDRDVREGAISAVTGFGAHTTSVTYWYELGQGSIIDSPGVRQFTFAELDKVDVRSGYVDIARAAMDCKFANCSHHHEPSCAVKDAVENKAIAAWRYNNYIKLTEE